MARRPKQKPSAAQSPTGHVRIISGLWRGRKLPVHDAQGLRPTTDRVKETLFNWLAQDIAGSNCLDLFAGSGGLSFEAASRQANHVSMLELNPKAYQQLSQNITALKTTNIEVHQTDTLQYLAKKGTPHDVVFIDPPFRKGLLEETIQLLENNGWLANYAMIYIECERELALPELPEHWELYREKSAGQVSYRLYERNVG
ncbi:MULTISPECIES: 16S rRNA (guanine(966)-N(2))-methyltransferase RsmD [Vibrio]|uniref:Ribosomal RNA small subunit methyltransferase D n=2 Tax=Vibrio TaxID=662 RepID=A0A7X4LM55_9VIBR|nr:MULTISPECIES: 16S rRNA (guanine(966)-N(2))-methyltransferase RsmD [Vibrio]MBF9001936.1 16S rRNA (guanine(966)-N(2))-methyltransferase RsmD [Vibrio nitrifigilis]MZI94484.1 16S rRNA (guanine(966)-N(2))-methyltransferase RsmD [Vibrio eleionomae]